jgi:hypothetical protein
MEARICLLRAYYGNTIANSMTRHCDMQTQPCTNESNDLWGQKINIVPYVVSFSGFSIFDFPFGILLRLFSFVHVWICMSQWFMQYLTFSSLPSMLIFWPRRSFLCGNRNGHHNMELRTYRHIIGQHKKRRGTQTPPKNWSVGSSCFLYDTCRVTLIYPMEPPTAQAITLSSEIILIY